MLPPTGRVFGFALLFAATACGGAAQTPAAAPTTVTAQANGSRSATARPAAGAARSEARRLHDFAQNDSAEVTRTLIEVAMDPGTAPALVAEAKELLAERRTGAEYMLEALSAEYDPLSATERPPPVGALADALGAMEDERAAPLLASKLNEPTLASEDLERAARALVTLASPSEAKQLEAFFILYRTTAHERALVDAVVAAAKALLRVGGSRERELVERARMDWLTQVDVRRNLDELADAEGLYDSAAR
jgi:hypothetical protein